MSIEKTNSMHHSANNPYAKISIENDTVNVTHTHNLWPLRWLVSRSDFAFSIDTIVYVDAIRYSLSPAQVFLSLYDNDNKRFSISSETDGWDNILLFLTQNCEGFNSEAVEETWDFPDTPIVCWEKLSSRH